MRLVSKILPVVAIAMLCAIPSFAQIGQGSLHGKVLDRDGKPLQGAVIRVEAVATHQTDDAKTNRNGDFSLSGLYNGKYKVTVIVDSRAVMVKGEAVGDDIYVSDGRDATVNFDLRNAPATPPPTPAATTATGPRGGGGGGNEKDRAAAEAERKAAGELKAAFDAGRAAMEAKNYDEAIKQFQLAAEKDPKQHVVFGNLGLALSNAKKYDDSAAAYKKAIELKPDEPAYVGNLSLALGNAGKTDEAIEAATKAAALDPKMGGQGFYNLGAILTNRGKTKEAVEAFKKAIEIDPMNANAYYQLGIAYFGSTDTIPEAVPALETYLKLQPNGPNAEAAKGLIEAAKAQAPAAFKSDRAVAQEKKDADAKAKAAATKNKGK
jgi:tetratricopeptide (TPR) repeat protein